MTKKITIQQVLLWGLLAITLVAAYYAPPEEDELLVEAVKTPPHVENGSTRAVNTESLLDLRFNASRKWVRTKNHDVFPAKIKPTPIVAAPKLLPPPPPVAPPLPYSYTGKVFEDGKLTVFVSKQQQTYILKGGEVLEGTYRVDRVEPNKVVFTYLPMAVEQVMMFGSGE